MTPCTQARQLQDYLDRLLDPAAEAAYRRHLETCSRCAAEVAAFERLFARLDALPTWDPGPALTERIVAAALPARPSRWVSALGWGYAGAVAASVMGITAWLLQPAPRSWLQGLVAEASHGVLQGLLFVLNAFTFAAFKIAAGWHLVDLVLGRLAPLVRAVFAYLSQPLAAAVLWSAVAACALLLWWLRPRDGRSARGVRHVGVLGF